MDRDEPGGMAFVDKDGNYMASLKLEDGLNSVPSQTLDDNTEEVNLGLINEDGTLNEYELEDFNISDNDLAAMAVADTFFSAVAMSPDLVEAMV
ncbi:MAG: hypothetical protein R6V52_00415, partial [Bacteroidales bacterium]